MSDELKRLLYCRGPDHIGAFHMRIGDQELSPYWVSLVSTVLALRGGHVTSQPFRDAQSGSSFCWNGEAWKIGSDAVVGNDGQVIFDLLLRASSAQKLVAESSLAVLKVLQSISGPFALIFVDNIHEQIYFGRDRLGRRSLLLKDDGNVTSLELSSIGDPSSGPWKEVEADAIYQLPCTHQDLMLDCSSATFQRHPWEDLDADCSVSVTDRSTGSLCW